MVIGGNAASSSPMRRTPGSKWPDALRAAALTSCRRAHRLTHRFDLDADVQSARQSTKNVEASLQPQRQGACRKAETVQSVNAGDAVACKEALDLGKPRSKPYGMEFFVSQEIQETAHGRLVASIRCPHVAETGIEPIVHDPELTKDGIHGLGDSLEASRVAVAAQHAPGGVRIPSGLCFAIDCPPRKPPLALNSGRHQLCAVAGRNFVFETPVSMLTINPYCCGGQFGGSLPKNSSSGRDRELVSDPDLDPVHSPNDCEPVSRSAACPESPGFCLNTRSSHGSTHPTSALPLIEMSPYAKPQSTSPLCSCRRQSRRPARSFDRCIHRGCAGDLNRRAGRASPGG
ncbi:hypothetical protein BU26DRAFT_581763 [Trematosphaeria pertusa]|uniref:Uncharacterized protein n=1 Tax=Trematosphaeria pertusa TaxID=390896 RepID=A0A6A6I0N8_9PLEO|nr:uncharacterized protein BU26DRAFT_581763 [Trematosphaeria pertusa]KAF2243542.1 hypothetical protein BU26DRAFT_581763 [Trematosphaeria pertusa]